MVKEANLLHPAFLVICGDLMNSSLNTEELSAFKQSIVGLKKVPLHLVAGNHDVGNHPTLARLETYRQRFGPDYYEFQSGPLIGIVLDSILMADPAAPNESRRQLLWLEEVLRTASTRKGTQIAIFQHIPFFVHRPNEPDSYWNIPLEQRSRYLALLKKYDVTHVFAGHLHYPAESRDGNLEVVTVGATGKPLGQSVSGFNLVSISVEGQWQHRYFPLTSMPSHLQPPW